MKKYKYYLDFDGCLTHSLEAMVRLLNDKYNMNVQPQEITSWNFADKFPINQRELEELFADTRFYSILEFIEGAVAFLKAHKYESIIITKGDLLNGLHKRFTLDMNDLEDIPMIILPLNVSKSMIDMSGGIFVDDSVVNLRESNARVKILFMEYVDNVDREWQRGWNGFRVSDWEGVEEYE